MCSLSRKKKRFKSVLSNQILFRKQWLTPQQKTGNRAEHAGSDREPSCILCMFIVSLSGRRLVPASVSVSQRCRACCAPLPLCMLTPWLRRRQRRRWPLALTTFFTCLLSRSAEDRDPQFAAVIVTGRLPLPAQRREPRLCQSVAFTILPSAGCSL